jgi:GTPase
MDCGGFEKYHRTNLQSYLTYAPDYSMLVINANKQLSEIEDQIRLAIALKSNFCIIVTHTDLVDEKNLNKVIKTVA